MLRLLIISDFTESFPTRLLKGIANYSRPKEQWIMRRMPLSYKNKIGVPGIIRVAKEWDADAVIGQFEETDDMSLFARNGIVVVAQDFKKIFKSIPNITADYLTTGKMAARFYLERGFRNFGFFGFNNVCWSDGRCEGFRKEIEAAGYGDSFFTYDMQDIDLVWYYERKKVAEWLRMIPKPIGIMACDDNQGNNLIEACHSLGIRIPTDVSVIGVDNDELLCNLGSVTMSSIHIDIEEGGYRTAELIEKLVLDPEAQPEDVVLKPIRIVGRMSTAAYATDDIQIQKAIEFIHRNIQKKTGVKDVMAEVALSRRLLERRFKNVTGQTLYQYISNLKIKKFADLLQETDEPIIGIAIGLGENDTKSISRRFKQLYGISPNEWRNHNKTTIQ